VRLVVFLIGLLAGSGALAQPACVHPKLDNFLEQSRQAIQFTGTYFPEPSARFLPFVFDGNRLQWMAVSWEGPPDGALFVLDCSGAELGALRIGKVVGLRPGPGITGFGQAFEAIDIPGIATGSGASEIKLVAFREGSISVLWTQDLRQWLSLGPRGAGEQVRAYTWKYSADGLVIQVTGKRFDPTDGHRPQTVKMLPKETFCWKMQQNIYVPCANR
jgi:hypothetical protein